jgi:hypothetical protein
MENKFYNEGITMQLPVSSLGMTLWLGVISFLLLLTSEFTSTYYGQINLVIDKKRLRQAALVITMIFLIDALLQIYEIFTY